ncbi:conserved hypothetical protein [Burkholderia vietnamiensis]|uniref:Uncharacterized protein n=1 Tax=Burkholderia vietnamiensis (strain G4 / LMG 22486) TaxID=269482 RepID=A4JBT8_BURVG|nr:hypothetical protein Bcep1808_0729 [Burkholderia vietnamiensis G4]CAG9201114.1 conserved hypothetical protein [Burkholderia vietnamiensis]
MRVSIADSDIFGVNVSWTRGVDGCRRAGSHVEVKDACGGLARAGVDRPLAMSHGRVSSVAGRSRRDISVEGYWPVRRGEPDDARVARSCSRRGAGEAAIGLALGSHSEQAFRAVLGATLRRWLRTQRAG